MNKTIKLVMISLLVSVNMLAQKTDNIQQQYGRGITVDQKESTTAGGTITEKQLLHKTSINPSNLLFGTIAGLYVLQNAGSSWADGPTMYIRGLGTTNSKSPLVLIDGLVRSISDLTVQEIETVTILKDAVALALYGIRGGNGVVYVTTKRGKVREPAINFNYEFNMGTPIRLPEMVNGYTYAQALNEGLRNDGLTPRYAQRELDAFRDRTYSDFYPDVDWWGEALRNHSYGHNANFSIQGGNEKIQYYAQLNYLNDQGILKPANDNEDYSTQFKFSKLNIRTNLDIQATKTTKAQLSMLGNFSEHNRPGTQIDDIFTALYQVPSGAFPIKTKNGIWGGSIMYSNNPIALISGKGYARSQNRALYADMNIQQDLNALIPGLSASVRVGLDSYASYWDSNIRNFAYESATKGWDGKEDEYNILRNESSLNFTSNTGQVVRRFNFNAQINYKKEWGAHRLSSVMLYAMDKMNRDGQNASRAYMDMVMQTHYSYKNCYLLDLALSGSASSVLEPNHRWGVFPSVGIGWVLSEEDWLKGKDINLLKLKVAYGIAGRTDFGVNLYKYYMGSGSSYYFKDTPSSQSGMKEKQIAVDGLTYEKSHKLNVGIDFMAWKKLSFIIDGYYDHRTDILVDGGNAISSVFGMTVPKRNDGIVDNYGVDLMVDWNEQADVFSYQVGGQISFNRSKIINMNEEYRPYNYLKRTGHRVGQIFGYEVEGIYKSQEEIDKREIKQYLSDVRPGDLRFKDQNNDKRIDQYDKVPIGYNTICPEIYYGFSLGAKYKGAGFSALFQGVTNYSQVLDTRSIYRPLINNNTISKYYWENRWSEHTPNGTLPRLTALSSENNYNNNSLWVTNASFLKLRTLEIYYQFPDKWLRKWNAIKSLKLYIRGHDLFCLDSIDIADPEALGASHPAMKQYTFGFNLQF